MKTKLHWIFNQFMAPADDDGLGGGGGGGGGDKADRGDSWTPTEDQDHADVLKKLESKDEPAKKDGLRDTEADDAADDAAEEEERKPKKDTRLPLSRHKEILDAERAKREQVERELAQYKQGKEIASTNEEITALEDKALKAETEYTKLIADGELDKAAAKMREIRAMEREINDKRVGMSIAAAEARAVEKVRYDMLVERMEEAYPQLNPDNEDFDKDKTAEVLELKAAYQQGRGYTPSEALQKAIKLVMGASTKAQKRATEVEPRVSAEDEAKAKAEATKAARAEAQRKKNLDAADKTPPDLKKVGQDSDKMGGGITAKDVLKMSQEDFAKLDDKVLAAMRGDDLEA